MNEFLGRKMVRGKCALGRSLGPPPPRKVLVCFYLSTSIRQCLLAGKSFLNAIILNCNWENFWGGSLSVWGRSFPPSRLNPEYYCIAIDPVAMVYVTCS